jgi:DNA-binding CsgD family transcriptional regulator
MIDYGKVPWRQVHDYLLDIESASTKKEFFARALSGVERLIPADAATALFDAEGRVVFSHGLYDTDNQTYNDYYRFRFPFVRDQRLLFEAWHALAKGNSCSLVEWGEYCNSEFVTDFARPHYQEHTIVYNIKSPIVLAINRSRHSRTFCEIDCATLSVVNLHLINLYSRFEKLDRPNRYVVYEDHVRELYPRLSWREAQIAVLLCRGLTASEIAAKLFINRRTVEWHLENLYPKLGARTKQQAISQLSKASRGEDQGTL